MSEYRPSYVSPPRDSAPYRSDRSFPKGLGSHNYSTTDLSYEVPTNLFDNSKDHNF